MSGNATPDGRSAWCPSKKPIPCSSRGRSGRSSRRSPSAAAAVGRAATGATPVRHPGSQTRPGAELRLRKRRQGASLEVFLAADFPAAAFREAVGEEIPGEVAAGIPADEADSVDLAGVGVGVAVPAEWAGEANVRIFADWRKPLDVGSPRVVFFVEACHLPASESGRQFHQLNSQQGMHFGWILAQS